jgi:hypothetical protein
MSAAIRLIEIGEYDTENCLRTETVPDATWEQFLEVFAAVQKRELRFAGITVAAEDDSFLLIDGSEGLFFVLYQDANGFQFQPLPDPSQPVGDVAIVCGGVRTTLPRAVLFDEGTLFRVAWDFWQGQLDISTGWEPL